jgi:cytochrome c peroxidase
MLPADMTLVQDKKFREWSLKYASDENLFFKECVFVVPRRVKAWRLTIYTPHSFSASFAKLLELGVPKAQFASDPWEMKTLEEQQ